MFRPVPLVARPWFTPGHWVGLTTVVLFVLVVGYLCRFALTTPMLDEWDMVPALTGEMPLEVWLWAPHNDHRYPLPKLIFWSATRLLHFELRVNHVVNAFLLAGTVAMLLTTLRRLRGRWHPLDALVPALLLHWGHYENLLLGYQVAFLLPVFLASCWLVLSIRRSQPTVTDALWGGGVLLLIMLCGGIGLAFVPWLSLWLGSVAWRERSNWGRVGLVVLAVGLSWAYLGVCLHGLVGAVNPGEPKSQGVKLLAAWHMLSMSGGFLGVRMPWLLGGVVFALMAGASFVAGRVTRKCPQERLRAVGLLLFLGAILSLALGIGAARTYGLVSRYAHLAAMGVIGGYFALVLYGPVLPRRLGWLLGVSVPTLLVLGNLEAGLIHGTFRQLNARLLEADVRAGMPAAFLAEKHAIQCGYYALDPGCPEVTTGTQSRFEEWQKRFAVQIQRLGRAEIGYFRHLQTIPRMTEVELPRSQWESDRIVALPVEAFVCGKGPNGIGFHLGRPSLVKGIRLELWIPVKIPWFPLAVCWQDEQGRQQQAHVFLKALAGKYTTQFWVDARLDTFQIVSCAPGPDLRLQRITLLKPTR